MKTFLNKIRSGVFTFLLLVLITSGCEDTFFNGDNRITVENPVNANIVVDPGALNFDDYLLRATFESDLIPGAPNKALPGLPIGDELKYATDDGIFVLYSHQQKSIYLPGNHTEVGEPVGDDDSDISFVSKGGENSGILTVTWSGQLTGHHYYDDPNPNNGIAEDDASGLKYISIRDGAGNFMAAFQISDLNIRSTDLLTESPCPLCTEYNWSYYHLFPNPPTMAQHQFTLTFNLNTKLFSIKFVNHDGTIVTASSIPFPYTPTRAAPRFTFRIISLDHGYIVDEVTIKQTPYIGPINPPF